jgi:hypothetical protein
VAKFAQTPLGGSLKRGGGGSRSAKSKILITSSIVLPMAFMSMVLANSITITQNDGGAIEFGQGAASTSVCESQLNTDLTSVYDATAAGGAGEFLLESITISGANEEYLNETDLTKNLSNLCAGRVISVIPMKTPTGGASASFLATFEVTPNGSTENTYLISIPSESPIAATDVDKILVQTEVNSN